MTMTQPDLDALFARALEAHQAGRLEEAAQGYHWILAEESCHINALANLGVLLRCQGKLEAAVTVYRRVLALDPEHSETWSNLGGALRYVGRLDEALDATEEALKRQPEFHPALYNQAQILADLGRPEEAIPIFDRLLREQPERLDVPLDRARALLQAGELRSGFLAYEERFRCKAELRHSFRQPAWGGDDLNGRTLLLYAEQGLGDTLQWCRYVPLIPKTGGARILIICQPELVSLLKTLEGVDAVFAFGEKLPPFDIQASLFSLPYLFQTELSTIPSNIPYLQAPTQLRQALNAPAGTRLKVGIVWASGHQDFGSHNRSCPLTEMAKLLEIPGVTLFSLQKGPAVQDLSRFGLDGMIEELGTAFQDFSDTVAAIESLDILVSIDTSVVHLAGAMAKPVYLLLPFSAEWRWLVNRENSPWYPTVRIFRADKPGHWPSLMDRAIQSVRETLNRDAVW
jgi:tetratricopeptide (TPR) repeat protein